ncbi:MAG: phosphatidate cytidylyltransferase [Flavobacteriales bacterium]
MLKQRVITAVIMMSAFLVILFFAPWQVFAIATALVFLVGAWEWGNLVGLSAIIPKILYCASCILASAGLVWWLRSGLDSTALKNLLIFSSAWWGLAFLWLQAYPASAVFWKPKAVRLMMGWVVLIPAWVASVALHSQENGPLLVLLCVLIIAGADVGAYFSGKAFGKRKLAPEVSPGKSWEGLIGGLVFAVVVAVTYDFVFGQGQWQLMIGIAVPCALISVVGDLFESMLKRMRGIKDSGAILPGHGGVLDRIDGLVAGVPIFFLAVLMTNWHL